MRKQGNILLLVLLVAGVSWVAYAAMRARRDRVTLNFHEADIATVARAIERQTWEKILVQPGLGRKVTIQAKDVPLARALDLLAAQADCEWTRVIALHRDKRAIAALDLRIASPGQNESWTNFPTHFRRPGFAPTGSDEAAVQLITYSAETKEATRVASDLSRFGRAILVLQDGVNRPVSVALRESTVDQAAATLAKQLGLKATRRYVLRPLFKTNTLPPPSPELHRAALPEDLRRALESGKRVQIPLGSKEEMQPIPGDADTLLPQPDAEIDTQRLQKKTVEDIRSSSPEQRLERLRQARRTQ